MKFGCFYFFQYDRKTCKNENWKNVNLIQRKFVVYQHEEKSRFLETDKLINCVNVKSYNNYINRNLVKDTGKREERSTTT